VGAPRPGLRAQRAMLYSLIGHVLSSLRAYWDLHRRPAADRHPRSRYRPPSRRTRRTSGHRRSLCSTPGSTRTSCATRSRPGVALRCDGSSEFWSSELSHSRPQGVTGPRTDKSDRRGFIPTARAGGRREGTTRERASVDVSCRRLQFVSPLRAARWAIEGQGTGDAKRVPAGVG
jgi:hypothetical protein